MSKRRILYAIAAIICIACAKEEPDYRWITIPEGSTNVSFADQSDLALETIYYQMETEKGDGRNWDYIKNQLATGGYEQCKSKIDGWHFYATTEGSGEEIKGDRLLGYFLKSDLSYSISLSILEVCESISCTQHVSVSRKTIRLVSDDSASTLKKFCDTGDW